MTRLHALPRLALAASALLLAAAALAQAPAPSAEPELTDAEVRKVDTGRARITLRHGPIRHLDMPGMTMVFNLRDKAQLAGLKPGDKVRVGVVLEGGEYTITTLQPAP